LFGRRSGETALLAGFLAQVDRTVIAEVPADLDVLLPLLADDRARNPANYAVLVVSEGATLIGECETDLAGSATSRGVGIGQRIAQAIESRGHGGTVMQELAYLMRAGEPDALDRMVGLAFGALAMQLAERASFGRLVALRDGNYCQVPIDCVLAGAKHVEVDRLYDRDYYRARLKSVEGMPMFLY
jgi:6-phosphofructokinase